jgi:hypothetical protein
MAKGSGTTRTVSANNASASRTQKIMTATTNENKSLSNGLSIEKVNSLIRDKFNESFDKEHKGWNVHYMRYGDLDDFSFNEKDGTLIVYATGKAYSPKPSIEKEIKKLSDSEYKKAKEKAIFNVTETKGPLATDEYGATRIANIYEENGFKVKKIILRKQWD